MPLTVRTPAGIMSAVSWAMSAQATLHCLISCVIGEVLGMGLSVPGLIANAGGVICAATEYRGGDRRQTFTDIEQKIHNNTVELIMRLAPGTHLPGEAAEQMALERIGAASRYRRRF